MSERASTKGREADELASASCPQERGTVEAVARKLSDALLTVRPLGGSELFMRVGEDFYADPVVCAAEIKKLRDDLHNAKANYVRTTQEKWEIKDALRECQAALAMMVSPERISATTLASAYATATAAEAKARSVLEGSKAVRADATPNPLSEGRERS